MKLRTKTKIWYRDREGLHPLSKIIVSGHVFQFYKEAGKIVLDGVKDCE